MFGFKFRKLGNASVWHPDVDCYEVTERKTGELVGYFYMDIMRRGDLSVHPSAHII